MINNLKLIFIRWSRIVILTIVASLTLWLLLNFGSFLNKAEEFKEDISSVQNSLPTIVSTSSKSQVIFGTNLPIQKGLNDKPKNKASVTSNPMVVLIESDKSITVNPSPFLLNSSSQSIKPSMTPTPSDTPTPSPSTTLTPTPTTSLASSVSPAPSPSTTTAPVITPTPIPGPSLPKVVINEIAWMGTKASQYAEWIELYNTTGGDIDLSGWAVFEAGGGTKVISLEGFIRSYGYFLIERTTPSSPDAIIDIIADVSGSFGGSGLSNTGEKLVLKDEIGNIEDEVNGSSGWYNAGIASPDYKSMERIDSNQSGNSASNWATNDGLSRNGLDAANNPINGTPRNQN